MRRFLLPFVTAMALTFSFGVQAQAPAVTATCKDGSPFSGSTRSGACRGHGGVKAWDTASPATTAPAAGATPAPSTTGPIPAPTTTQPVPSRPAPTQSTRGAPSAGQVWVNTASKVYHCPGDRWYGKTKTGEYMSEAQAKSSGFRADHSKACAL